MNQTATLRITSSIIALLTFTFFIIGMFLQAKLPADILAYMHQLPHAQLANYLLVASACIFSLAIMSIWQQNSFAPLLMLLALVVYMVGNIQQMPRINYAGVTFFNDFSCFLLGVLYAMVCSHPYNQIINTHYNLATIKNFRICGVILLGIFFLFPALRTSDTPVIYASFAASANTVGFIGYLQVIELIALIGVFLRSGIAKYVFIITTVLMWDFKTVLVTQEYALDPLFNFLQGAMVTILLFKPLSEQVKITIHQEIPRIFTFFSKLSLRKYYQKVAYKKTGWGIRGLIILVVLFTIPAAFTDSLARATKDQEIRAMLRTFINSEQPIAQISTPYKFYDKNQNLIGIMDLKADSINQYTGIETLRLLITNREVIFYDTNHKELSHQTGLSNATYPTTKRMAVHLIIREQLRSIFTILSAVAFFIADSAVMLAEFLIAIFLAAYITKKSKLAALGLDFKARFRLYSAYLMPAFVLYCFLGDIYGWVITILSILLSFVILPRRLSEKLIGGQK